MAETNNNRSTGTVKWFSAQKGFGFIAPDDGGEDLFVHQTSIRSDGFRTLSEGEVVEFIIDYGEDGRTKAVDVANQTRSRRSGFGRGRGNGGVGSGRGGRGRSGGGYGGYGGGYSRGGGGRFGDGAGGRGGGGAECYNCGRLGHLARDCYQSGSGAGYGARGGGRSYGGRGGGYGGGGRGCYNCGEEGHLARDCPNDQK